MRVALRAMRATTIGRRSNLVGGNNNNNPTVSVMKPGVRRSAPPVSTERAIDEFAAGHDAHRQLLIGATPDRCALTT